MVKNSKFDLDLQYGQLREQQVHDMFHNKKIEIKTERNWWKKTGNIAIEYECNGKPSGIDKTESDFWIQILANGTDNYCKLIVEEFWRWWILSMVTINTVINSIVFVIGRKFKPTSLYKVKNKKKLEEK